MTKRIMTGILTLSMIFSIVISPVDVKANSMALGFVQDDSKKPEVSVTSKEKTTIDIKPGDTSTETTKGNTTTDYKAGLSENEKKYIDGKDTSEGEFKAEALEKIGFNTEPPAMKDPEGNEIDPSQNPLGSGNKAMIQNLSLAVSGLYFDTQLNNGQGKDDKLYGVYDVIKGKGMQTTNFFMNRSLIPGTGEADWRQQPKVMASADLSQDGFEEVITAVLIPAANNTFGLTLIIQNYNQGKDSSEVKYQLISSGITLSDISPNSSSQSLKYKKHFRIAASKNKVAILLQRDLYNFDITYSKSQNQYDIKQTQKFSFTEDNSVAPIANKDNPMIDLEGADIDYDGLSELLVTTGSDVGTKQAYLLAYRWEDNATEGKSSVDFANPLAKQELIESGSRLKFAGITVGNAVGRGNSIIVGGYDNYHNHLYFMCLNYNQKDKNFKHSYFHPVCSDKSNDKKYSNVLPEINMMPFEEQDASIPQYILCNDQVYRYSFERSYFEEQYDISRGINALQGIDIYDTAMIKYSGSGSIDSLKKDAAAIIFQDGEDFTYLVYLVVGSTDSILFSVYHDRGLLTEKEYGKAKLNLNLIKGYPQFFHPAICGTCVKDRCYSLEFLEYSFTMCDPKIIAVLGASPYYKEFESEYGNGFGNVATTFGTSIVKESEQGQGTSVSVSAAIGFEVEISAGLIVSKKIGGVEGGVTLSSSMSWEWSEAESTELKSSFSAVNNDMVVLTSVPYYLYKYKIHDPGQKEDGKIAIISIPGKPQTCLMNLDDYNKMAEEQNKLNKNTNYALVPGEVLHHTVGDPRTYASTIDQIPGAKYVVSSDKVFEVGTGDGVSELGIEKNTTTTKSFEGETEIDAYLKVTAGSVFAEGHVGGSFKTSIKTSITNSTQISGSVACIPSKYKDYSFSWKLVGYKYGLRSTTGNMCYVVNYIVTPGKMIPPLPPKNVQLLNYNRTSALLSWDEVEGATEYRIYRSTKKNVSMKQPYDNVKVRTDEKWLFHDTRMNPNQQYYYAVSAVKNKEGRPTEMFAVPVNVDSIELKTPPRLEYKEGEALNLSDMVLQYHLTDDSNIDMAYPNLYKRGVIVNIPDGKLLEMEDDGVSIIITDPITNITVISEPLVIAQSASTAIDTSKYEISSYFKVDGMDHAQSLKSNSSLIGYTTIKNKQNTPQKVLVVVTLYDQNGGMVQCDFTSKEINSGSTEAISVGNFTTPAEINDYEAKILVFEGGDFDSSTLMPITKPVTIHGN